MRWFISAVANLQYCGRDGLEIEEGLNFAWTGRHNPWFGWMHVYSMNKAGKGIQHRPVINPNGGYDNIFSDLHRNFLNPLNFRKLYMMNL